MRLLQNIRHEHIVAFVAALSLPGGHFCYLQEFARGGTLDAAIRARRTLATPFASTVVARWMRQLATAMAHLHELRVLHRDLSTKNIFLSQSRYATQGSNPRLADARQVCYSHV